MNGFKFDLATFGAGVQVEYTIAHGNIIISRLSLENKDIPVKLCLVSPNTIAAELAFFVWVPYCVHQTSEDIDVANKLWWRMCGKYAQRVDRVVVTLLASPYTICADVRFGFNSVIWLCPRSDELSLWMLKFLYMLSYALVVQHTRINICSTQLQHVISFQMDARAVWIFHLASQPAIQYMKAT